MGSWKYFAFFLWTISRMRPQFLLEGLVLLLLCEHFLAQHYLFGLMWLGSLANFHLIINFLHKHDLGCLWLLALIDDRLAIAGGIFIFIAIDSSPSLLVHQ